MRTEQSPEMPQHSYPPEYLFSRESPSSGGWLPTLRFLLCALFCSEPSSVFLCFFSWWPPTTLFFYRTHTADTRTPLSRSPHRGLCGAPSPPSSPPSPSWPTLQGPLLIHNQWGRGYHSSLVISISLSLRWRAGESADFVPPGCQGSSGGGTIPD